ncbi:MAG: PHP domain-containing protein [Acidobacteriaceae bacterium]|nr:PHP domain-containing protein [Acidobacteriaceae bacterium]MBV9036297.1 PHP domain-containing protein [Acidobacteriaceae bacterium]
MSLPRYIDLHSHTTESDGSYTPEELIDLAVRTDLQALAITDHDTFSGYEMALPFARKAGLDLVRGIELNSRLNLTNSDDSRAAHLLGLFPSREPSEEFINWIEDQRSDRRERNRKLAETLQERGVKVTLEEAEARGRNLTSRTHFAQILIEKGYVNSFDEAFREYLGEDAPSYVARQSLTSEEVIRRIRSGGGVSVVAHPVRLSLSRDAERQELIKLKEADLAALEIYHSDQDPQLQAYYHQLAQELDLLPTGGSDFHGRLKPDIDLGTGLRGNVRVPFEFLQRLREFAP